MTRERFALLRRRGQDLIVAAQGATFRAHGLEPPSRERSLSIVGLSLLQAFRVLAPDGPAESLAEGYKTAFQRLRADPAYREPLFKGAAELLAELAARAGRRRARHRDREIAARGRASP